VWLQIIEKKCLNAWKTVYREWLISLERRMACLNRNVLALWSWVLRTVTSISLKPAAKHHHLHAATGPAYHILCKTSSLKECGTFFVARSKRNIPAENGTLWMACKLFQWHGNPSKLLCKIWLQHCKFSHHQRLWRKLNEFNRNATLIAPVLLTSFLMSTNLSLKLMLGQQVWTALAPAACMSWDRKRDDRGNIATSHLTTSWRCSDSSVDAEISRKFDAYERII